MRAIRRARPSVTIAISTDGMPVRAAQLEAIMGERLVDYTALPGESRREGW